MTDGRAEQLFQEWSEEQYERLQESQLAEASLAERRELDTLRRDASGDEWLEKVDQYARKCLREMSAPGHTSYDLEKGEAAPPPLPTATPVDEKPKRSRWCKFTFGLPEKILVRNAIVATIALFLPFWEIIQTISYNTSLMIPILALILALRPIHMTCLGYEMQQIMVLLSAWPFYIVYSILIVAISPRNIVGYLVLFFVGVLIAFLIGVLRVSVLMTLMGPTITFSIIHVAIFQIYNMNDYEYPFTEVMLALGGATFGIGAAFIVHWLSAVLIFPWSANKDARQSLQNRYAMYASVLRHLRPVYDRIAIHTLDPKASSCHTRIEKDLIDALDDARQKEISSIPVTQKWVNAALLETRFFRKGDGYRYLERYTNTLNISRSARAAAADVVNNREDFEIDNEEDGPSETLEFHKSIFRRQDSIEHATIDDAEAERKALERENIPVLITKLNLLLELGAHRMAKLVYMVPSDRSNDEAREHTLKQLEREQGAMEKIAKELEDLAITWMQRYLRTHATQAYDSSNTEIPDHVFFKRTKLISYVLVLLKLVKEQKQVTEEFAKESIPDKTLAQKEWDMTFPFADPIIPTLHSSDKENLYKPFDSWISRWEHATLTLFSSNEWKLSFKFALGTTFMVLPGMLQQSYKWYSLMQFVNGIFAFQVVLFKSQTGLVIERVIHRLCGVIAGAIIIGVAWELACINGCTDENRKWILFAFEVVALLCYLWFKTKWPPWGYAGYSMVRTLVSISVGFVKSSDPSQINVWKEGGYVIASSAIGATGALFLSICFWPTSGRDSIREAIAGSYHDFIVLVEQVLTDQYEHPYKIDTMSPHLAAFEHRIARTLYLETGMMLRSVQLEDLQHVNFDAPLPLYSKAVKCSQEIWQSLWKLNHLGGVQIYLRDKEGNPSKTMNTDTAQIFFAANRWLTTSFAAVASQLNKRDRSSSPVLRPIAASPRLLNEVVHNFVGRAYRDELFLNHVMSSRDLALMLNLPLLADCLHEISRSLDGLYELMETYLRTPIYADRLREAERLSFDLYKIE